MRADRTPHPDTAQQIANLSRHPFRDQVAFLLQSAPTREAIESLAERSPDRYWQAVAIAAKLAGYSDKLEVEASVYAQVSTMSDAELQQAIENASQSLPCYREGNPPEPQQ